MGNLQHWVILPLVVITLVALPCVHAAPFGTDSALRYQPLEAKTSNQLDRTSQFTEPNDNSHGRKPDLDRDLYHYSDRLRELIKRFEKTRQKAYWSGNHGYGNDFVIVDKVECYVCKGVTWVLQQTLHHNEAKFAEIADDLCTKLQIEPPDICHGIVALFKDEFATVLEDLALDPDELCGLVLGPQCSEYYDPYGMWNISLPDPPAKHGMSHEESTRNDAPSTLRVLQLADIHLDIKYQIGANVHCDRPQCCRNTSGPVNKTGAGFWGSYGSCDLPTWTLENLFSHLSKNDKFDYIIWTGDLPSHADWDQSREGLLHLMDYLTTIFIKYFPDTPIYWSLGNHEGIPVDSFPPPYIKGKDSISWLYTHIANSWAHWLPSSTKSDILRGGYYSAEIQPGYRLVSLNMNYCHSRNWWMLLNTTDPTGELDWFVSVLHQAELVGEKVHVIGHIPPADCLKAWSWNYYKIVSRFSNTISGQFFGHTHTDSLMIFYDVETLKHPLSVAYVAPSVTTYSNLNPGYRVYTVDGFYNNSSWSVVDHETYILNLTEANKKRTPPPWTLEYTAKSAYSLTDLTPESWQKFSETLLHNNNTMLKYYRYRYKSSPDYKNCDRSCMISNVCNIRTGRSHDPDLCRDLHLEHGVYRQWLLDNIRC